MTEARNGSALPKIATLWNPVMPKAFLPTAKHNSRDSDLEGSPELYGKRQIEKIVIGERIRLKPQCVKRNRPKGQQEIHALMLTRSNLPDGVAFRTSKFTSAT